jgi:hypothetical protein
MWFVQHLIFSALSDTTRTRSSVNSGHDAEAQSFGLVDLLTLILWNFGYEDTIINALGYSASITGKVLQ